jgi:hypothetical protein
MGAFVLLIASEDWNLLDDIDKVISGSEAKCEGGGVLDGCILAKGLVGAVDGLAAGLEKRLLADWMR